MHGDPILLADSRGYIRVFKVVDGQYRLQGIKFADAANARAWIESNCQDYRYAVAQPQPRKVHLYDSSRASSTRCGHEPANSHTKTTEDPDKVTCGRCTRLRFTGGGSGKRVLHFNARGMTRCKVYNSDTVETTEVVDEVTCQRCRASLHVEGVDGVGQPELS